MTRAQGLREAPPLATGASCASPTSPGRANADGPRGPERRRPIGSTSSSRSGRSPRMHVLARMTQTRREASLTHAPAVATQCQPAGRDQAQGHCGREHRHPRSTVQRDGSAGHGHDQHRRRECLAREGVYAAALAAGHGDKPGEERGTADHHVDRHHRLTPFLVTEDKGAPEGSSRRWPRATTEGPAALAPHQGGVGTPASSSARSGIHQRSPPERPSRGL